MRNRRALAPALVCAAALLAAPRAPLACGFEDPTSVAVLRGALNVAFPQSLHVGTAIWQAQLAGQLPRDPIAQRDDLSPEGRAALRMFRANTLVARFAAGMGEGGESPSLAVVLVGPVLWSRLEDVGGTLRPTVHVAGPQTGDVVVVTDIAVLDALTSGALVPADALDRGLMRLYGSPDGVAAARARLTAPVRG